METQIASGPHYVAQIKEWQKEAWGCALRGFFQLDLEGVPSDEADNRLRAAWKKYLATEGLTAQEALKQRNDLLTKHAYHFPYSPGYPAWFGRLFENVPLADIELIRLTCRPFGGDASPNPYQIAIIRERISELADEKAPGFTVKIARLEAAIAWLNGSGQRPAALEADPAAMPTAAPPTLKTNLASQPTNTAPSSLSLRQVALLTNYTGGSILKSEADEIARRYGHTSGAKLYDHYRTVSQRAGRIGDEITGQKLGPMIADISAVIPHLTGPPRQQAERELQTLLARKEEK